MSSYRATSEVGHRSMKKHFPRWAASNSAEFRTASQPGDNQFQDNDYVDFVLSSNWILRPAGLSEFYDQIRKRIKNPEITYEIEVGCFQIRCRRHEQQDIVIACNEIMDNLVKDVISKGTEDEQLIFLGTCNNDMVRYISEWRAEPLQEEEIESYEVFSYPSEIVTFPFKGTWKIPKPKLQEGLTIQKLFLSHDPVKLMRDTTTCTVISSTDGTALHIGANSPEEIYESRQKLENILKYYDLDSQIGIQNSVIYAEDTSTGLVELRFIAQIDRRYLRNVVLDPTRFRPSTGYSKLFEKGSLLRSTKREQGQLVSAAAQLSPAAPQEVILKPFFPFLEWKPTYRNEDWGMTTPAISISRKQTLSILDDDHLNQVNVVGPQTTPRVLEWANAIPPFHSLSIIQDQEPSEQSRSRNPTLGPSARGSVTSDLITINDSSVGPQEPGNASLRMNSHFGEFITSPGRQSRIDVDNTTERVEAESTTSVALEKHFMNLKEALSTFNLKTVQKFNTGNIDKSSEGEDNIRALSETDSDKSLFGEFYAPQAIQETPRYEPLDILSTSPQRSAQDIDILIPAPTPALPINNSNNISTVMRCKVPDYRPAVARLEQRGLDPDTENRIYVHLSGMLEPYRLYQGIVNARAEIGRFWFTNINWQHISIPGLKNRSRSTQSRSKPIQDMEDSLKSHCVSQDMYFNNILSLFGGDANYIINIPNIDNPAVRMWVRGRRRGFYEFWCVTKSESGLRAYFVLEIDDFDFHCNVRKADPTESNIYVHCAKRDFDFRVVIEASSDIENTYGSFAREVASSLRVTPQGSGSNLPVLEFAIFREWGVEIKNVRYRQEATFDHCENNTKLHITQVHCMKKKTIKKDDVVWRLSASPDLARPDAGCFPTWFEAYITSNKIDKALAQNHKLKFAEEASWTPESLQGSGAIGDLLKSATNTVQQMDGVGFYVNNQQDDMRYGKPPYTREEASVLSEASGPVYTYW